MESISDIINSYIVNYTVDSSTIQNVQAFVGQEMKVNSWISLILSNKECITMKFNNGEFMNEGYVLNDDKVLKMIGKCVIGNVTYNGEPTEEGIVDLDHGSRFEGKLLKGSGIPFGFGKMYDDDGLLVYKGIVINWKRFGNGVSYHNNGSVEYEGYWCDDKRCGSGKLYDRNGKLVKEGNWCNGAESNIDDSIRDGSQPISVGIKHLKLSDNCVLKGWDVSLFYNLESIEIGDNCFGEVKTFKIDGLKGLKSVKIGKNSFTQMKNSHGDDKTKSFHILNCESLESIEIGKFSFSDFGGEFELKQLNSLQTLKIGAVGFTEYGSWCFCNSSFVVKGSCCVPSFLCRSSKPQKYHFRKPVISVFSDD